MNSGEDRGLCLATMEDGNDDGLKLRPCPSRSALRHYLGHPVPLPEYASRQRRELVPDPARLEDAGTRSSFS